MRQKSMLLACALALGIGASSPAPAAAAKGTYYIVTHVDLRKCISPICGGWFVKRVNHAYTKCADGTWQPECHVLDLDVSAIGLSEEEEQKLEFTWGASHALVRGSLSKVENGKFDIDTLHATEAWAGVAESTAKGSFYGVTDSGIVCITFPCASFTEAKLNTAKIANIHGVDLAASGAIEDDVNAGYAELAKTGVLVAGNHTTITGPAGKGTALVASEFYSHVLPASKCDPMLICTQALTCFDGQLYPTGCGPANCDAPIGPCEVSGTR